MTKDEALCRYCARQIWNTQFQAESIQGDEARISFESLVAAGIATGIRALAEGMAANQSGNIDDTFTKFTSRIV